jgi:fructose-bisphosphate aldolase class II
MKKINGCVLAAANNGNIIPGFNVFGYEEALAIVRAAERADAPVLLMVSRDARANMDISHWGALLASIASQAAVPVGVHLDHCSDLDLIIRAMDCGFTSVMYDGSKLPLNQNIANTRIIVQAAHERDIAVEGEVGSVPYDDLGEQLGAFTSPDEARQLSQASGLDWLAVSVGNIHRLADRKVALDFHRLGLIEAACNTPLVIHGASGILEQDIQRLKKTRVGKVNIGTALRQVIGETLRGEMISNPQIFDRLTLMKRPTKLAEEMAFAWITALQAES